MKSIVTLILAAAFVVPAYSQTKLDSGVILPKKHSDAKSGSKPTETPKATKAEKAPKSDKKAAKK
jgi:hypothetical protein